MEQLTDILYVEDDLDIQSIAKFSLEEIGKFNVRICDNGADAIAALTRVQPQLILLDVMMPGIDGLSTFRAIRTLPQAADIPIIFITARVQKHEVDGYMNMGALGVIEKPFDAVSLSETVQNLWKHHLQQRVD